ncbi:hypothetical protein ACSFCW_16790 [Yokenella regensburgei]|uniref:hypothetical protein n=1 Tax=Yokenella regensburgei TaxID=158877 RepID=UPI003EDA6438
MAEEKQYRKNNLKFVFINKTGKFDDTGNNTITIDEIKSSFKVGAYGNQVGVQAEIVLYGLSLDLISMLSSKGVGVYTATKEDIAVEVFANGDKLFSGFIFSSYANMNAIPDSSLIISAMSGLDLKNAVTSPFSKPDTAKVVDILKAICEPYSYNLRPIGIDGITSTNTYLAGSPLDQIRYVCNSANLQMSFMNNVITVWPGGLAVDDIVPQVSPDYGLIGYPVFTQGGITFQTRFSTLLSQGRNVKLTTSLPHASGVYNLFSVEHFLSSWMKNGPWHTLCQGVKISNE